ncbi:MAG: amidohydrolase family protein [Planctomycetota bacterium]
MRIFDAHVHMQGDETPEEIKRWLDASGVERVGLISEDPCEAPAKDKGKGEGLLRPRVSTPAEQRRRVEHLGGIAKALPDRVAGLAWVEPTTKGVVELVEEARERYGIAGIKLIPNGWYPCEERFFALYEKARDLSMPILFHTGILWSWGDTSRFCRSVYLEALMQFTGLRFAMAHVAWPWTDECIATAQKFQVMNKVAGHREGQAVVDLTPGTPEIYREDVLRKVVSETDKKLIIWGTDFYTARSDPATWGKEGEAGGPVRYPHERVRRDAAILESAGLEREAVEDVFYGNARRFYGMG